MKPSEVMPAAQDGGGIDCDRLPKASRTSLDEDDAKSKGDEELVLVRTVVEMADDHPLHQHAEKPARRAIRPTTATMKEPVY